MIKAFNYLYQAINYPSLFLLSALVFRLLPSLAFCFGLRLSAFTISGFLLWSFGFLLSWLSALVFRLSAFTIPGFLVWSSAFRFLLPWLSALVFRLSAFLTTFEI